MLAESGVRSSRCAVAFLALSWQGKAIRCEPFDLSSSVGNERRRFENVLRQTPQQILAPVKGAVTGLLSLRAQMDTSFEARQSGHADALSLYGQALQSAYKQSGVEDILRALLTVHHGAMDMAKTTPEFPLTVLRLADALFDLCRTEPQSAETSLTLFLQAEDLLGRPMCNAKIVLLCKQLGRWVEGDRYAKACGLSMEHLHLQHPKLPTKPWWTLNDLQVPKWLRSLSSPHVHFIRSDLQSCLARDPGAFDDAANDWFFVGSRFKWTGLNLMHSARGGWNERWCGLQGCARYTCEVLRWRRELNYTLWQSLSEGSGITSAAPPPMYVNFYALAPGTRILPHLGNDGRLTIHLALEVPPRNQSRIRVGNRTINYTHAGQLLIFDDAYDHEVWNDGSTVRYVLGITVWHPKLLLWLRRRGRRLEGQEWKPEVPGFHFALSWRHTSTGKVGKVSPRRSQKAIGSPTSLSSLCRGRILCTRQTSEAVGKKGQGASCMESRFMVCCNMTAVSS